MNRTAGILLAILILAGESTADAASAWAERLSSADGKVCWQNPGCGWAGGGWSTLETNRLVEVTLKWPNQTKLWSLQKFSKGYLYNNDQKHYAKAMHYCGGADIPLNAFALASISNAFESCRQAGGTVIPRFAYTWDGYGGCEPDDFETMITHIRQLAELCALYRDVIPAVECGMIGAYGEMHTSRYCGSAYARRVTSAWLDNTPEDMMLLVRSPCYVLYEAGCANTSEFLASGAGDRPRIRRMGFYNDGYLGTDGDYGTWGGGSSSFTRSQGRDYLRPRGNVAYGGEFAGVTDEYFDNNVHLLDPTRFNIVEEWYDTHLSYLRTIHATGMTIYKKLAGTAFDSTKWAFDNMPYVADYDGETLQKFCEDHMGYRFLVRDMAALRDGRAVRLFLKIENTGFGRLCFGEAKEILLSGAGGSATVPATGTDLRLLEGGKTTAVEVGFTLPDALPLGAYRVGLRVRVPLADERMSDPPRRVIAFANAGAYDAETKANVLGTLLIDGGKDEESEAEISSGGQVMVVAGTTNDMRAVRFSADSVLTVAGGGTVLLGDSVPSQVNVVNGEVVYGRIPDGFDPSSVHTHGNRVTLRNDSAVPRLLDLDDRTYDGFRLAGNFRYVVPAGETRTIASPRWIADFDIDVFGTLDVRADLTLAGGVTANVSDGGVMGNLGRTATSGPGKMIVRDRAKIAVGTGGRLLNPVNGNWSGSGLELMTQEEGVTSLLLDGGTASVFKTSGTGLGRIEVASDSVWEVWYGTWYGNGRSSAPFKGASEVAIADGARLTVRRIKQDFGDNQQDAGDIAVQLADVHVTGGGDLRFENAHPSKKAAFTVIADNGCTGSVSVEEGTGATLAFAPGSGWAGDVVVTPNVTLPDEWWFAANMATGATFGGMWESEDVFAVTNRRAQADCDAVISVVGIAGWTAGFPDDPGMVSFLFLCEQGGLAPYGYTAEGWKKLYGTPFEEYKTFELEVDFKWRAGAWTVGFTADGVALADADGRTRFAVDYDPAEMRRIAFAGYGQHGDFRGRLTCRRSSVFYLVFSR